MIFFVCLVFFLPLIFTHAFLGSSMLYIYSSVVFFFRFRLARVTSLLTFRTFYSRTSPHPRAPSVISSPLIMYALAISSCAHICRPERERPSCPRNQIIYDIYALESVRPGSCSKQGRLCIRVSMHHLLHRQCATWMFRLRTGNGSRNCKDLNMHTFHVRESALLLQGTMLT